MKLTLTEFNVIVLANTHNPSIINPDFIRINKIVDTELNLTEFLCTPPFSQVTYDDGVSIVIDNERLTFSDKKEERLISETKIPDFAVKYIEVLKYVPYKAVGVNFTGYYEISSPDEFLLNKFIKDGIWCKYEGVQPTAILNFSYATQDVVHNLNISPANITRKKEARVFPGVRIHSNFHYSPKNDASKKISEFISTYKTLHDKLSKYLEQIIK